MDRPRNLLATRRELLAGLGALAVAPAVGAAAARVSLRGILDGASAVADPAGRLAFLRRAPAGALDPEDRVLLRMVDRVLLRMVARGLEREVELRRLFPFGKADGSSPYVLSQRHGAWLELGASGPSVSDKAKRLDLETARLRAEAARGIVPPAFILDAVLEAEAALRGEAAPEVRAALDRQRTELGRLRARAVSAPGVWRLPGGADYYRLRLRRNSGLDDPPEEIERRVAAETAALLRRADGLLKGLGLSRDSVGARLRALKRRPEHVHSNDEAGRTRAIAGMNAALARLRPHLGAWFNPPFEFESAVRRMSAAEERAGKRGYRDPATGSYFPDLAAVHERPAWTLATVAYHETVPGHLLQLRREARANPHPLQVGYAPGFPEGWAIYAEALVDAMGPLTPAARLGFIQSLLFRLARVTCDIGIHLRRWDRARAIRYLEETVGFELFFPFAVEVDRYAVEPGSFAGDAMVALTLMRLGRGAATAGRLREFHDAVLNRGPLSAEAIQAIVWPPTSS